MSCASGIVANPLASVVLAITKDDVSATPTLLRTYDKSAGLESCATWQAVRATTAATTFFKPIKVGRDDIEFIDAAFGYSNPCAVLIEEGRRQFPGSGPMCVLSIGSGMGEIIDIGHTRGKILKALGKMATNSQRVARELHNRYHNTDHRYFRFNVERGLQDVTLSEWRKSSKISAHTSNYLEENAGGLDAFVECLLSYEGTITTSIPHSDLGHDRETPIKAAAPRTIFYIPYSQNQNFLGRDKELQTLHQHLSGRKQQNTMIPVSVIHSMGGMGKTQLALEYTYRYFESYDFIFWLPAETGTGLAEAFAHILRRISDTQTDNNAATSLVVEKVMEILEQTGMAHPGWYVLLLLVLIPRP